MNQVHQLGVISLPQINMPVQSHYLGLGAEQQSSSKTVMDVVAPAVTILSSGAVGALLGGGVGYFINKNPKTPALIGGAIGLGFATLAYFSMKSIPSQ